MEKVEAVLLDVDGTLVDSNDAHAHAWVDVGREFGHAIAFDEVRWLIGMGGDRVLPRLTGLEEESEAGARILERRGEIFRGRYLPTVDAFPGARELLERLLAEGRRLVVATSSSKADLDPLLEKAGLADLIRDATNSDDAEQSKPAPDIVEAALGKTGHPAEQVVMLGDTPYDVKASQRAGVALIGFRCGGWTAEELHGAVEVWQDPAELLAEYGRSVLSR